MGNNISSIFRTGSTPVANLHPKAWADGETWSGFNK